MENINVIKQGNDEFLRSEIVSLKLHDLERCEIQVVVMLRCQHRLRLSNWLLRYLETISIGIVKARGSGVISAQFASVLSQQKQQDFSFKKCAFTDGDTWAEIYKEIHLLNQRSITQIQSALGDHLRECPFEHLQSKLNLPSRYIYLLEKKTGRGTRNTKLFVRKDNEQQCRYRSQVKVSKY